MEALSKDIVNLDWEENSYDPSVGLAIVNAYGAITGEKIEQSEILMQQVEAFFKNVKNYK